VKKNNKSINFLCESLSEAARKKSNLKPAILVSVIIPVYDVELYIKECLDSVSNQTYRNLEIIVVDDGTPDNAGHIADECAQKDKRIKVVHQKNGGVSSARNKGLDLAAGDYVTFIDGDDYVMPDYLDYLLQLAITYDADFVCSAKPFTSRDKIQFENDNINIMTQQAATAFLLGTKMPIGCWNKLYRKGMLVENSIKFDTSLFMGEGLHFITTVSQRSNKTIIGQRKVYYYRTDNNNSATYHFDLRKVRASLEALDKIYNNLIYDSQDIIMEWQCHVWRNYCLGLRVFVSTNAMYNEIDYYKSCKKQIKKYAYLIIRHKGLKSRIKAIFTLICPVLFTKLLIIKGRLFHNK
jgi:glycosyltransferase involved in cell wall biosynthesis